MRRILLTTCLAVGLAGCSTETPEASPSAPIAQTPAGVTSVPNRWLVQLKEPSRGKGGRKPQHERERQELFDQADALGLKLTVLRSHEALWNGLVVELEPSRLPVLAKLTPVSAIFPVVVIEAPPQPTGGEASPDLLTAITMTGADVAQNTLGLTGLGVRVGIIDTGIDYRHPDLGGCFGPGCRVAFGTDFVGDAYDSSTGAPPVPDGDPLDCGGHGTHVTGIVGANGILKGAAPEVTFGAYKVFGCTGTTDSDTMIAAMERAAADGMRVVNMSIGSPFQWPEYPSATAAETLNNLGVIVVTSNGNSGTAGLFAAGAPGTGRGSFAVGSIENTAIAGPAFAAAPDGGLFGYSPAASAPLPPQTGTMTLVHSTPTATTATPDDGCAPIAMGALTGKAALIRRGTCGFYVKAINAQNAGAVAVVLYNNAVGTLSPTVAGNPPVTIPVVAVTQADGVALDGRMTAGQLAITWTNRATAVPNPAGGQVSGFSSWGPTADLDLKPDLSAPGGSIYSTYLTTQNSYASLSGTSMASPHIAGLSALMVQARPELTPADVRTALSNTAVPVLLGTGPNLDSVFRQGAGLAHVDVAAQSRVLVTPAKLPLRASAAGPATVTLTFKNLGPTTVTYDAVAVKAADPTAARTTTTTQVANTTVSFAAPNVTVPPGGTATLSATITADAALANGALYSGWLVFTPQGGGTTLRVPFGGLKGDYQQAFTVLTPTAQGYPWLASKPAASYVKQATGATYTLQGTDVPWVVVHFEHFARKFRLEAFDAVTNKPWGLVSSVDWVERANGATATNGFVWNGEVDFNKQRLLVPNGTYVLKVSVLKALGDESNPAHWETWTSPFITLNHP